MVISMNRDDVVSFKGGLRSGLTGGSGKITIRCAHGTVWVTVAGDSGDHVLSPGKELTVSKKGKIVIMAQESSSLRFFRPVTSGALVRMGLNIVPASSVWQEMRSR